MVKIYKFFPVIFLAFGILLIGTVSTVSIGGYIKNRAVSSPVNSNANSSNENHNYKNDDMDNKKIFFNKPGKIPEKTSIKVYKKKKILELYADKKLIGRFDISLGSSIDGKKEMQGDNKTPEGNYYICYKTNKTKHTYFIGISYPNIQDAKKGLEQGTIDKQTFDRIKSAIDEKKQPPWNTALGGDVGIHGGKDNHNLTCGSVMLSNDDINILKKYVTLNTPVDIYE
ncbi:L,D-transpeptidase family protein [Clostridium sp. JN-1]|uniref:L,D-transpeptidase family protein n=1 Tax=Clostridium sp. JN-1 TaxID=2483110 RepID=UPI000F0B3284|nr:L,D-transpeptidase family protein [Clostridium sp. JN-1]